MQDAFRLWLEPKRWLDDLEWVRRKNFFAFVFFSGVIHFGLLADGLFAIWVAFDSPITPHNLRIGVLIWPVVGGAWAAVIWLIVYWHSKAKNRKERSQRMS